MKCRKCGKSVAEGATLVRVNEIGVKGIWECSLPCGIRYISEDAKLLHIIRGGLSEELPTPTGE